MTKRNEGRKERDERKEKREGWKEGRKARRPLKLCLPYYSACTLIGYNMIGWKEGRRKRI
jgi:hypothetical protein